VEHSYTDLWRRFQKALKQRNQLLRHGRIDEDSLRAWTRELIPLSEEITRHRTAYLGGLVEHVKAVSKVLDGLGDLSFEYYQGWADGASLAGVMDADRGRDVAVGTTSHGAHKADMKIKVDGVLASDCLSRGQIKLLVYALKLAQATFYRGKTGESCLFLLDDLPAELDSHHRQQIVGFLRGLDCQVFMTGVDKRDFQVLVEGMAHHMFHVEHGVATKSEIMGS
jgi:DNA replication and repair protein RecF